MKQKLTGLKQEIDNSTITVGDSATPLSIMDRTPRQTSRQIEDWSNSINQLALTDIYRITPEYTFFLGTHSISCKINDIQDQKASPNKC